MKKKILLFVIISLVVIITVFLGIMGIVKHNEDKKDHHRNSGEYLSSYNLDVDEENMRGFYATDDKIYYLVSEEKGKKSIEHNLYQLDINTRETKKINGISDNKDEVYCNLQDGVIICGKGHKSYYYDLNFKEIFNGEDGNNGENNYYPYKGKYLRLVEDKVYINDKETKIPNYRDDLSCNDYYANDDNTYLLFLDSSTNFYYIYDVANNKLTNTNEINYIKYSHGFYFYTSTYYHIYDLDASQEQKVNITNVISLGKTYYGTVDDDIIYQYNESSKSIEAVNLKKATFAALGIYESIPDNPYNVLFKDDKIFMLASDGEKSISGAEFKLKIYVIDLTKIDFAFKNIYDYYNDTNKEIEERIAKIKEEYDVDIHVKDRTSTYFPDFTAKIIEDNQYIMRGLDVVESVLKKFPSSFFKNFYHDDRQGLNIYLSGELTPRDLITQASNPVAYSLILNSQYTIVLDVNNTSLKNTVCHEIMHNIEYNMDAKSLSAFNNWDSLNPSRFHYSFSYTSDDDFDYTPFNTNNKKDVYFINYYSHTYPIEDRAVIFGSMCESDSSDEIKEYPNLYKKAQAIKEEIIKNYPEMKDSIVLKNY